MASLIFNWKLFEAESRILKQSSEQMFSVYCWPSILSLIITKPIHKTKVAQNSIEETVII